MAIARTPSPGDEATVGWNPGGEVDFVTSPWPRFRHHWPALNQFEVGKIIGHSYLAKKADLLARVGAETGLGPSGLSERLSIWLDATAAIEAERQAALNPLPE